ncbi:ABC transporter permease [Salinicoccus roseus]|uniref:Iron ABC transporter permease n=1 Tax=Salinicoccus roseus TaxID=45670 RepID=A0A265E6G3_9STAP|nr:ABC transporter permease [Salinicoccus roseus]MBY8910291.1 ABC transporter permease [Salinicoccus roseus]OZT77187.1 iron ABC transporter permease [Salinicoccus roseus]
MIHKLFRLDIMIILLVVLSIVSMFVGVVDLAPGDLFNLTDNQKNIIMESRFPRTIAIIIAGASLSVCGLIMQQLTRNKFVSPTTAGTMDWARLGILIALMFFPTASLLVKLLFASALSLAGTLLFMQIIQRVQFKDVVFVPLIGLMLGNVVSSVATFLSLRTNSVQSLSSWLQGDFSIIISGRYEVLYISIPFLIIALLYANQFTIAGMGQDFSKNLGLNYRRVINIGLLITAVITALVVVTVGMLPFLGLIIPNIISIFRGDHLKNTILQTAVLGAVFVMICDILGRVIIFPYEISIGLMIGVIGSFIFLIMIFRRVKSNA